MKESYALEAVAGFPTEPARHAVAATAPEASLVHAISGKARRRGLRLRWPVVLLASWTFRSIPPRPWAGRSTAGPALPDGAKATPPQPPPSLPSAAGAHGGGAGVRSQAKPKMGQLQHLAQRRAVRTHPAVAQAVGGVGVGAEPREEAEQEAKGAQEPQAMAKKQMGKTCVASFASSCGDGIWSLGDCAGGDGQGAGRLKSFAAEVSVGPADDLFHPPLQTPGNKQTARLRFLGATAAGLLRRVAARGG
eukprot:GHVT01077425.1.p2 GENE.GHVT01077425.1~~GHVT01077425.1.p2  ORF type:complete len:249 (-),score=79.66 GHVT01077425.1:268-1014(-)